MNDSRINLQSEVLEYITARRCKRGGYCFYRLEEPNAPDTYYALSTLSLLSMDLKDDQSKEYLRCMQDSDGSYPNLAFAFFTIRGLGILKGRPRYRPRQYIEEMLDLCIQRGVRGHMDLNDIHFIVSVFKCLRARIKDNKKQALVRLIDSMKNEDGGFGRNVSNLENTSTALLTLKDLSWAKDEVCVLNFVKMCEDRHYGFVNVPGTSPGYLEHIHAGIVTSALIGYRPSFLAQTKLAIHMCMNDNGGFSRSIGGGISTLENTYRAIHSLKILSRWNIHLKKGSGTHPLKRKTS